MAKTEKGSMSKSISTLSLNTFRIEADSKDTQLRLDGHATGFFCQFDDSKYLVTNWHVVSGINPITRMVINSHGAVPGKLICSGHHTSSVPLGDESDTSFSVLEFSVEIDLYKDETPIWLEHPVYGSKVDVVAIPIESQFDQTNIHAIDVNESLELVQSLWVTERLFIVGYPLSAKQSDNTFPIHKSGPIASEPYAYGDVPRFFVDAKTKRGMSGSPVVLLHGQKIVWPGERLILIGVYSGRDGNAEDEHEAELGRVWPIKECLLPILQVD